MPQSVLSVSSQVAYGPVGNSAAVPAMESLGLTVHAVPTIVLSNHPGHGKHAGTRIPARDLSAMLDTLMDLDVLPKCSGVMTGYFAADDQVFAVARTIRRMKEHNPSLFYLCDPILGDEDVGLYVPVPVAKALQTELLPLADCMTPNTFELQWLSQEPVNDIATAARAANRMRPSTVVVTSVPDGSSHLLTVSIGRKGESSIRTLRRPRAPHGTGDLFSGLFFAHCLIGADEARALADSIVVVERAIDASAGSVVLNINGVLK